jgi:UDP-N-acetylglucosamine 2-epimerase (non-hydrolysing)
LVLIATKPDIIKQAPLILALREAGEEVLVVHSGQHYDWNLSGGLEREFGIEPDVNLNVRGSLYEQQSQIISRLGFLLIQLKKMSKLVVPYIYGDTTTAVAGGVASFANLIGTAHVEAGLRTMSPPKDLLLGLLNGVDTPSFFSGLRQSGGWHKGSYEPYPEQFDTRAAAPSAGLHFAPTHLNAAHLRDEGFARDRIFVVGNPVSDAVEFALARLSQATVLDQYPALRKGNVIRFCIHRRENVTSRHRFSCIIEALIDLVREGRTVLLISLGATERALAAYDLRRTLDELQEQYDNFVYSPVWPHYTDVVAAMQQCRVVATDSGSIQEETSILGVPGVVLRFNSDRPEAIFAGANILAPPISGEIVSRIIREVADNLELHQEMRQAGNLYGRQVSRKIVDVVRHVAASGALFEFLEHERLGLTDLDFWRAGKTEW